MIDVLTRLQAALADRYRIQRELGRGGMATVYLAEDLRHKRNIALKLFRPELAATIGPERFLREIETAARLQHPHILPVFDSGEARTPGNEAPGLLWYTMPYVEGESLRDRLRREVQLPVDEAVRVAREVALALNYAHRQGVVHRDIKPENVLLSEGQALVSDFGVAWVYDAATAAKLTESGMVVAAARWLLQEGDTVQAARLLTWHDGWIANPTVSQADLILSSPAILESARIDEARGRPVVARAEYERFLRLYDLPVASQRSLVEEARQAVRL